MIGNARRSLSSVKGVKFVRTISVNLFPSDVGTTDDAARAQRALRTGQKALISQLVGFFSRSNEVRGVRARGRARERGESAARRSGSEGAGGAGWGEAGTRGAEGGRAGRREGRGGGRGAGGTNEGVGCL